MGLHPVFLEITSTFFSIPEQPNTFTSNLYCTRIKKEEFPVPAIQATRTLISRKPWLGNRDKNPTQHEIAVSVCSFLSWIDEVSRAYEIAPPQFRLGQARPGSLGGYAPAFHTIIMPKFSVITLAHEFRHAWQWQTKKHIDSVHRAEEDARAWPASLVYIANPEFYMNAVGKDGVYTHKKGESKQC